METLYWDEAWSDKEYEWPVTSAPHPSTIERIRTAAIAEGGRAPNEAHADRGVTMDFPNGAMPDSRIRKQITRAECRRQAQVVLVNVPEKLCVVCDAMHLWPALQPTYTPPA